MGDTIRKWDEINGAVKDEQEVPGSVDALHQEQPGTRDDPLKNAEMQMEDDYDSIDGIINNGKKYEEPEAGKPKTSVVEEIRAQQKKIEDEVLQPRIRSICPEEREL